MIDGDKLFVIVPRYNIDGRVTSKDFRLSDRAILYLVITSFIHWNVTNKALSKHYNVMAYPDKGSIGRGIIEL